MKCIPCLRGLHSLCEEGVACECTHTVIIEQATPSTVNNEENGEEDASQDDSIHWRQTNRVSGRNSRPRYKRDAALKDQQSTGRKRAARLYPLDPNASCEWRGQSNAGGGEHPILGCTNGNQTDRHHGPDKAVTNNEPGNVHRICSSCHHQWHADNNEEYDWQSTIRFQHSPYPMTDDEWWVAVERDIKRKERKLKRIKD